MKAAGEGILSISGAFLRVWERNARVFVTLWKFNLLPALMEPLLFIFVFGVGLGSYIETMEGVSYLEFVAAGILATAAVMQATFECTYGSYFRMRMQNTFEGIISTPVSAAEVGLAEVSWGATRGLINSVLVLLVLLAMGVFHSPRALLVPLLTFMAAFNFAAVGIIVTSRIAQMEYFHFYFAGFVVLAQFICGTFFPVDRFPEPVQVIAWVIPLTSFIDLIRSLMLERLGTAQAVELLWAVLSTLLFTEIAVRSMSRRLVR